VFDSYNKWKGIKETKLGARTEKAIHKRISQNEDDLAEGGPQNNDI
jgi:hypothetical protein